MFALLALAGDLGCVAGPSLAGTVAELCGNDLQISFIVSTVFPLVVFALIPFVAIREKKKLLSKRK
jgi:MFS-type transporter involved in bile tolerance (Atg22 family)